MYPLASPPRTTVTASALHPTTAASSSHQQQQPTSFAMQNIEPGGLRVLPTPNFHHLRMPNLATRPISMNSIQQQQPIPGPSFTSLLVSPTPSASTVSVSPRSPPQGMNPSQHTKCPICKFESNDKIFVHYGGVSCYGCRAFFRRAHQDTKDPKFVCKKSGKCEVSVKTRRKCQKCRYDLCLKSGMDPELVLSDDQKKIRFRNFLAKKAETRVVQPSTSASNSSVNEAEAGPSTSGNHQQQESHFVALRLDHEQRQRGGPPPLMLAHPHHQRSSLPEVSLSSQIQYHHQQQQSIQLNPGPSVSQRRSLDNSGHSSHGIVLNMAVNRPQPCSSNSSSSSTSSRKREDNMDSMAEYADVVRQAKIRRSAACSDNEAAVALTLLKRRYYENPNNDSSTSLSSMVDEVVQGPSNIDEDANIINPELLRIKAVFQKILMGLEIKPQLMDRVMAMYEINPCCRVKSSSNNNREPVTKADFAMYVFRASLHFKIFAENLPEFKELCFIDQQYLIRRNAALYVVYVVCRWAAAESGEDQLEWLMDSNVPRNLSCRQHRLFSLKEIDQKLRIFGTFAEMATFELAAACVGRSMDIFPTTSTYIVAFALLFHTSAGEVEELVEPDRVRAAEVRSKRLFLSSVNTRDSEVPPPDLKTIMEEIEHAKIIFESTVNFNTDDEQRFVTTAAEYQIPFLSLRNVPLTSEEKEFFHQTTKWFSKELFSYNITKTGGNRAADLIEHYLNLSVNKMRIPMEFWSENLYLNIGRIKSLFSANPDLRKLENSYPGLTERLFKANWSSVMATLLAKSEITSSGYEQGRLLFGDLDLPPSVNPHPLKMSDCSPFQSQVDRQTWSEAVKTVGGGARSFFKTEHGFVAVGIMAMLTSEERHQPPLLTKGESYACETLRKQYSMHLARFLAFSDDFLEDDEADFNERIDQVVKAINRIGVLIKRLV